MIALTASMSLHVLLEVRHALRIVSLRTVALALAFEQHNSFRSFDHADTRTAQTLPRFCSLTRRPPHRARRNHPMPQLPLHQQPPGFQSPTKCSNPYERHISLGTGKFAKPPLLPRSPAAGANSNVTSHLWTDTVISRRAFHKSRSQQVRLWTLTLHNC